MQDTFEQIPSEPSSLYRWALDGLTIAGVRVYGTDLCAVIDDSIYAYGGAECVADRPRPALERATRQLALAWHWHWGLERTQVRKEMLYQYLLSYRRQPFKCA